MAALIELPTFSDERGKLTVLEKVLPFDVKRVYYIYDTDGKDRGGHRHHKTVQALICIKGRCVVDCDNSFIKNSFKLDSPKKCLVVYPEDYHIMRDFSADSILLVLASEYFIENDYIDEAYD